ncbi:phage/plasmid replication protein [uncultured Fusobacterium sp.]|uniref:phage/plasmid replication domain-containing protein n=1 Tax=uncultured Fusobacterium sp. TaxID=159267 RepID=UPI0025D07600|nr:phage/plasmid replication protein [uncultured Fusobacterium sp.]
MVDKKKIFRIGIDKISLYNFSIKTNKEFQKLIDNRGNCVKEKTIITDELFSIINSYTLFQEGEELQENIFNKIVFNPNKLLTGDNICNTTPDQLPKVIEKLTKLLKEKGVEIDFSEAKIADIEINLNVPVDFNDYSEVFTLFYKQLKKSKLISEISDSEKISEFRIDESYFSRLSRSVTFKIYSKDREKGLNFKVTRLEYYLESLAYKYAMSKYNLDSSLKDLIANPKVIEDIFRERVKKDFIIKSLKYIDNNVKPVLEREYIAFKKANALAKMTGRKEERNVYKYLEKFWIFDYSFLIELIEKHNIKNKGREIKRVLKKYIQHDNLKKLNYLLETIFPH